MKPDIKLSGDYIQGYTAALADIHRMIPILVGDLKRQKARLTAEELDKLVEFMIKNRAALREHYGSFVRRNANTEEYEIYIEGKGVYNPTEETP